MSVVYNGTSIDKIVYNGTEIFGGFSGKLTKLGTSFTTYNLNGYKICIVHCACFDDDNYKFETSVPSGSATELYRSNLGETGNSSILRVFAINSSASINVYESGMSNPILEVFGIK